jgi:hypothetical protein
MRVTPIPLEQIAIGFLGQALKDALSKLEHGKLPKENAEPSKIAGTTQPSSK